MSQNMLLGLSIFVFTMLAIGLVLTVLEFKHGKPAIDAEKARARDSARVDSSKP